MDQLEIEPSEDQDLTLQPMMENEEVVSQSENENSGSISSVSEYLSAADHLSGEENPDNEALSPAQNLMETEITVPEITQNSNSSDSEEGTPRRPYPPSSRNKSSEPRRYPKRQRQSKGIFTYNPKTGEPEIKRYSRLSMFQLHTKSSSSSSSSSSESC